MKVAINNKINLSKLIFTLLFFTTFILSNSLFVVLKTSSLNSGLIFSILVFIPFFVVSNKVKFIINESYFLKLNTFALLFFLQLLISVNVYSDQEIYRSVLSIVLLYFTFLLGVLLFNYIYKINEEHLHSGIKFSYKLLLIILISSITLQELGLIQGKSMILFKEPSHFMLVYMPILLYSVYFSTSKNRFFQLIINIMGFLLIENLIAFVGLGIIFTVLFWREKKIILAVPFIVALPFVLPNIERFSYYIDRLSISIYSNNLSVLVWISGWERAYLSLFQSVGLGVGFQRMGFVGDKGIAMQKIFEIMNGQYINLYDGGSLAPKLVNELGFLGIIIVILYVVYLIKVLNFLKSNKNKSKIDFFLSFVFIMFSIQIFFRGVGYFAPATLFFSSSVYWVSRVVVRNKSIIVENRRGYEKNQRS